MSAPLARSTDRRTSSPSSETSALETTAAWSWRALTDRLVRFDYAAW